jgi:hypothetical protein
MKRAITLGHVFVERVPEQLSEGTLYVCIPYATVVHKCCCGCGNEVVTPLSSTEWRLTFDGESISLDPSIGNWSFPCQSHYWILNGHVGWARRWSEREIQAGRVRDRWKKERQFGGSTTSQEQPQSPEAGHGRWLTRLRDRLRK